MATKETYTDPNTGEVFEAGRLDLKVYPPGMIPSLKILTDPSRCTLDSSDPIDQSFLESLVKTGGNMEAILARRDSSGQVWVYEGRRRKGGTEVINANPEYWSQFTPEGVTPPPLSLQIRIVRISEEEALRHSLHGNNQKELSAMDRAHAASTLMERLGWTQERVATEMGVSGAQISLLLRLLTFPTRVQKAIHKGTVKVSEAHKLYGEPIAVVEAIMDQFDRGQSHSEIFAELKKAKREKVAAEKISNPDIAKRAPSRSLKEFKEELEVISASGDVLTWVANLAGKLLDHLAGNESHPLVEMMGRVMKGNVGVK